MRLLASAVFLNMLCVLPAQQGPRTRVVENIVPWLDYNSSCWSTIEIRNLASRDVIADVEAHKPSGALVSLRGHPGMEVRLHAGEQAEYRLDVNDDSSGAWVNVRETIPSPDLRAALAVSGATECVAGDSLLTANRDVVRPMRNPWYSSDVKHGDEGQLGIINTSEAPVIVSGCYSSGVLYADPRENGTSPDLTPVCNDKLDELIPPFGSRQFSISQGANSHFSLHTTGDAVVVQMLRPAGNSVKAYRVDSSITFGHDIQ